MTEGSHPVSTYRSSLLNYDFACGTYKIRKSLIVINDSLKPTFKVLPIHSSECGQTPQDNNNNKNCGFYGH